jgi:hypothetical protein
MRTQSKGTEPSRDTALMTPEQVASFDGADIVVLLPTLNEEKGLAATLPQIPFERMRTLGWTVRPLVIDGPSTDHTRDVARAHGVPVLQQLSRGKGAAIRQALDWLAGHKVRYCIVLDADSTYPGEMVPAVAQLLDAGSQLVVGIRQPVRSPADDAREFVHRVGNRLLNMTASQLSGLPILDLCSGFWGVRVDAVPPLHLETNGFEIEAELFTKSYRAGYDVTQIPIIYTERIGIAKLHAVRDGIRILLTTLRFGRRTIAATFSIPRTSAVRDLLSVAIVHGATDFIVLFDATRRSEASVIATRLRAGRPGTRVSIRSSADVVTSDPIVEVPPVTITLPALVADGSSVSPYALVHLPRTHRMVELQANDDVTARSGGFAAPSGYRLEYAPGWAAVDRVRALIANSLPSGGGKELAFFGANGHSGSLAVWKNEPTHRSGRVSADSLPSTRRVDSGASPGVRRDESSL